MTNRRTMIYLAELSALGLRHSLVIGISSLVILSVASASGADEDRVSDRCALCHERHDSSRELVAVRPVVEEVLNDAAS